MIFSVLINCLMGLSMEYYKIMFVRKLNELENFHAESSSSVSNAQEK